jgi:hypothetical protein
MANPRDRVVQNAAHTLELLDGRQEGATPVAIAKTALRVEQALC